MYDIRKSIVFNYEFDSVYSHIVFARSSSVPQRTLYRKAGSRGFITTSPRRDGRKHLLVFDRSLGPAIERRCDTQANNNC